MKNRTPEKTAKERKLRAEHRRKGLCTMCSEPVEPSRKKCAYHLALVAEQQQRNYARSLAAGHCQKCSRPVYVGSTYCERHMKAKRRVRRAKEGHRPWRPGRSGPPPLEMREDRR